MIIRLMAKNKKALTPYEMRDNLKKQKIKADVVTIYRILETLEELSLAHKVLALNGYIACDLAKERCHHYLLCKKCHRVDEVEGENLAALEKKIAQKHEFSIDSHYLEFTGLCAAWQKTNRRGR